MKIVFDYDGTLHDTSVIYLPAFRKTIEILKNQGLSINDQIKDEEILSFLGYPAKEVWQNFAPHLSEGQRNFASSKVHDFMLEAIEKGQAKLYEGAIETLEKLKKDHELIFLSNCKKAYKEVHIKYFKLDQYFSSLYSAQEENWDPKEKILKRIIEKDPGDYLVIGDRHHDLKMAKENNVPFIGCLYGFGEEGEIDIEHIAYVLDEISELPEIIRKLG